MSISPPTGVRPAGWFPDAAGSATERWWDGAAWTEHTRSALPPGTALPISSDGTPSEADAADTTGNHPREVPRWRLRRAGFAIAACAVLLIVGGAVAFTFLRGGDTSHVVVGVMVVATYDGCGATGASAVAERKQQIARGKTTPCPDGPGGGYSDIHDGAGVVMRDGTGKIIGTSSLTGGIQQKNGVTFSFKVESVPDVDFYTVEVARRGELRFSHAEMKANSWLVNASLG